ncbi:Glutamate-ammonia-ligase adenylyltransferase [Polystyrenella longa]|uniref:Glutamate-ammonia-ligase adenylyltransferase n=1 Tax=Polystyrenella longa TaxID=2528007 RepID=A0A518CRL1_9PLAN|nr:glutamine synthetase adenylyltransferase [Polystyrenella longa]QDU81844.1 Glutamate-ammonia-ligase adenylyltransferase [Polystyrenella longa]
MFEDYSRLLNSSKLTDEQAAQILGPVGFDDLPKARQRFAELCPDDECRESLGRCLNTLLVALSDTASPDGSLINFERYVQSVEDRSVLFEYLANNPRGVEILIKLFVGSQFLTEILLRNPDYLNRLTRHKRLSEFKYLQQFIEEEKKATDPYPTLNEKLNAIRRYQHWELLRIGACDSFGLLDLKSVTVQLSLLADSLIQSCLRLVAEDLKVDVSNFVVIGFGKLGGEEINYSSDIDLVFLTDEDAARFWGLGQKLINALMASTGEGFMYRVDMRLRPWGRSGALVNTVKAHIDYLKKHGMTWEKQALLKARIIAGNSDIGKDFLRQVDEFIFTLPEKAVRENIDSMKSKIEKKIEKQGHVWGEVKQGPGSIRDIEFVTQYIQLRYGGENRSIRHFTTLEALIRLADFGYINAEEYRQLSTGYSFLRTIEHSLQLMHYKQTHHLPESDREMAYLARRLDYPSAKQFIKQYEQHSSAIRRIYEKYILKKGNKDATPSPDLNPDFSHIVTTYKKVFEQDQIDFHIRMMKKLNDDQIVSIQSRQKPEDLWELTVIGFNMRGSFSVVCGLLFVYGFNIEGGHAFTNLDVSPENVVIGNLDVHDSKRKFINVFLLKPPLEEVLPEVWDRYQADLCELLTEIKEGRLEEAQGRLAKRVAHALKDVPSTQANLYPVTIEIDNDRSTHSTVLTIESEDTIGFLYEMANALSLNEVDVGRVIITSENSIVHDTIFVTTDDGSKITDPKQLDELRAAIVLIKHFTHLLPHSPNPETALLHFRDFLIHVFNQPDWAADLASLRKPDVLNALARLLGVSDFLWEDFLRLQLSNLFPVLKDTESLKVRKEKEDLRNELNEILSGQSSKEGKIDALNAFKDREMFRIDMRHILDLITEFGDFSAELSDLAEVVVESATNLCLQALTDRYGSPLQEDGSPCRFSVCALGKCGGRELGFASDIELVFLYEGSGKTEGPESITTNEFFQHLVEQFKQTIRARQEGIFQLDLRLRPYGRAGSLAVSKEAFEKYFSHDGPAWPYERQALVKLRHVCGDEKFGHIMTTLRDELIYHGPPFDVSAMRAMREKQVRQLIKGSTLNAKLSPGGLVDIEYLVQGLQINYGRANFLLRSSNTRQAISALHMSGIFSPENFEKLRTAHMFQRRLIDALRMVRGNAKDLTVPAVDSEEFEFLARRLGYQSNTAKLKNDLEESITNVLEISRALM